MEKDIGEIQKNNETKIIIRIDDFGGQAGLTIREFVKSERYTGFTKAGVRIKAEKFEDFKSMINSIDPNDLSKQEVSCTESQTEPQEANSDDTGINEQGLI